MEERGTKLPGFLKTAPVISINYTDSYQWHLQRLRILGKINLIHRNVPQRHIIISTIIHKLIA